MGLQIKVDRSGMPRSNWYGVYVISGIRHVITLPVPIEGNPPASLRVGDTGDSTFEKSRKKAQKALNAHVAEDRQKGRADHLTERLIASKTGRAVEYVKIADLAARWRTMGREMPPSERYLAACDAVFSRFTTFARNAKPPATYLYDVTQKQAAAYVEDLQGTFSRKTCRDHVKLLRRTFAAFLPVGAANPFAAFVGRRSNGDGGTVHRKPFTALELTRLLKAAREDSFLYPLVVTAACTGMRRGDVCRLRWQDVDLAAGMVTVKTSKTGAQVEIPIFPPLREILVACKDNDSKYVFPQASLMMEGRPNPDFCEGDDEAKRYLEKPNSSGLTWRFKALVARTFADEESRPDSPPPDPATILTEGLAAIDCMSEGKRRDHTRDTFMRYMAGASVRQIAKETGASKPSVSGWLSDVSGMIGKPVVRNRTGMDIKSGINQHTRVAREKGHGQRSASIRDWHALRATWVTLALSAGVPMELVRRVTGHATVEIVLKYYFRPGREQFKAVLAGALPDVLTGRKTETPTASEELNELAGKIADGTITEKDKARLRKLAAII